MADITVSRERFYRVRIDEFAIVRLVTVSRYVDDEGEVMEREKLLTVTPDDDIASLPARLRTIVQAARYPEAVERYEQLKAAGVVGAIYVYPDITPPA